MKQSIKLLSYTAFISAGLFILSPEVSRAETVVSVQQFSYDSNLRVSCTAQRMNPSVYGSLPSDACTLGTEGSYGKDRITKNVYDAAGQLTQVFQAYGTTDQRTYATFSYSNNGKVIDTIDANGNRTHNVYDGFDRLVTVNYPSTTRATSYNGSTQANALATANAYSTTDYETYGYDANDNKTSWRRRDGNVIYYSYDNLNRQTLMDLPGGTAGDVYTNYDAVGHVLSRRFVSTSGAGVSYAYDGLGRVSSTTDINGFTISYQYNQASARTALIYPDGNYIGYTLDAANRITATGWNSYSGLFSQSYDDLGRLTGIGKGGAGSTTYGYDGVGRLSSQANDLPGSANDVTYSFTSYNPASQIVGINTSSTVYDYVETTTSSTNRTFDGLNRNAGIAALSGGYDARGNLTYDGTRTFTYDVLNRLYYKHSTDGAVDIALSYDPEGRLYGYNSGGAVTYFLYDGTDLIGEYSAGGALLRRYVHSSRDDDPQVWLEGSSNGNISYVYTNYQGSVIATTNAAGSNLQIYKYSPYGEPRDASNNAAWYGFRFRYTGQQILPEARLYHYKARAYDPNLGTFLQTDPIGDDDDTNLYVYTGDDPVNKSDPTGTEAPCITLQSGCWGDPNDPNTAIREQQAGNVLTGMAVVEAGAIAWEYVPALYRAYKWKKNADDVDNRLKGKGFNKQKAAKGEGYKYNDPNKKGNNVRVMRGNRNATNASQKQDYVKIQKNGQFLDKNGNPIKGNDAAKSPQSHIKVKDAVCILGVCFK